MNYLFSGLKSWYFQRITALFLLLLLPYIFYQILSTDWNFKTWNAWIHNGLNSVILLLSSWLMVMHAWIGLRNILIDYVSNEWLRLVVLTLVASAFFSLGLWITILLFNS